MKFLYADSLDFVDPDYNFLEDRSRPGREPYWDDQFPHEYLGSAPYDGLLVSRGIVGDHKFPGKYTQPQAMRFRRDGARAFFRLDKPEFAHLELFGDCGAFSFCDMEEPPYTPQEILEFYEDAGFSHGCSLDHVIFEFEQSLNGMQPLPDSAAADRAQRRFDITLSNAEVFLRESHALGSGFTPLGVVQGWSPGSMAKAARSLVGMGYDYLAIGGMVPLSADSIHIALRAIRAAIPDHVRLHILGFGKIDQAHEFLDYNIASIDTTSPLLRAFKDNQRNFFMPGTGSQLEYFTALRIPHATESRKLNVLVKKGHFTHETLRHHEGNALTALRDLDVGKATPVDALDAVMAYTRLTSLDPKSGKPASSKQLASLETEYARMLNDRPWQRCSCNVCRKVGVEAAIFRASNRNKRRGIHNIWVFNTQLRKITGRELSHDEKAALPSHPCAAE